MTAQTAERQQFQRELECEATRGSCPCGHIAVDPSLVRVLQIGGLEMAETTNGHPLTPADQRSALADFADFYCRACADAASLSYGFDFERRVTADLPAGRQRAAEACPRRETLREGGARGAPRRSAFRCLVRVRRSQRALWRRTGRTRSCFAVIFIGLHCGLESATQGIGVSFFVARLAVADARGVAREEWLA
jgi:hypothetical protein